MSQIRARNIDVQTYARAIKKVRSSIEGEDWWSREAIKESKWSLGQKTVSFRLRITHTKLENLKINLKTSQQR